MSTTDGAAQGPSVPEGRPATSPRLGKILVYVSSACSALAIGLLLLPNQVHVDTEENEDIFFGCGLAIFPTAEPYEEPGISECDKVNARMRSVALVPALSGSISGSIGGYLILRRRRSPSANSTVSA